jgi:hypothetical protein
MAALKYSKEKIRICEQFLILAYFLIRYFCDSGRPKMYYQEPGTKLDGVEGRVPILAHDERA